MAFVGLNTELDSRALGKRSYPRFLQMTHEKGVLSPRPADESFTPPVALPVTFLQDTFTEASTTSIDDHTPDIGGTWAKLLGSNMDVAGNVLTADSVNVAYNNVTPPDPDYYIEATVVVSLTINAGLQLRGRMTPSREGYELILYTVDVNTLRLRLLSTTGGGGAGILADVDFAHPGEGAEKTLKLEMNGTTIKGYLDGTEEISETDSTYSDAGEVGILLQTPYTADNLICRTLEAIPAAGEGWKYWNLENIDFQELDFGEDTGLLTAYVQRDESIVAQLKDNGSEEDLVFPVATEAPAGIVWVETGLRAAAGFAQGSTYEVGIQWMSELADARFGIGPTLEVEQAYQEMTILGGSIPNAPTYVDYGITLTGATSGATATFRGILITGSFGAPYSIAVDNVVGTFQSGETLNWTAAGGAGSGTVQNIPSAAANAVVYVSAPSAPTGVERFSVAYLDPDTAVWYPSEDVSSVVQDRCGARHTSGVVGATVGEVPYRKPYQGPLDEDGLIAELIVPPEASLLAEHHGVLYLAADRYLYPSEPLQYRFFVKDRRLDLGAKIYGLVPREDVMEIYTAKGVQLLVGEYPSHVLRNLRTGEGPGSAFHVADAPLGTFVYCYHPTQPTIRLLDAKGWQNISIGYVTPWLRQISGAVIMGSDDHVLYIATQDLSGSTYRCLAFDHEKGEWFERTLPKQPIAFHFDETTDQLIIKYSDSTFESLGSDRDSTVNFEVEYPERGGPFEIDGPEFFLFDVRGSMTAKYYADGSFIHAEELENTGVQEMPLPEVVCKRWSLRMSGTGKQSTHRITSWEAGGGTS